MTRLDFEAPFSYSFGAGWSISVARRAHNPKVRGSNPLPATNFVLLPHFSQGIFVFDSVFHSPWFLFFNPDKRSFVSASLCQRVRKMRQFPVTEPAKGIPVRKVDGIISDQSKMEENKCVEESQRRDSRGVGLFRKTPPMWISL